MQKHRISRSTVSQVNISEPVAALTSDNISILDSVGGYSNSINTEKISDTIYQISFDSLDKEGDYTVKISGITDKAGNSIENDFSKTAALTLPDLTVENITAPSSVLAGETFDINWNEKNIGNGAASSYKTQIYFSSDEAFDTGDILLKELSSNELLSGSASLREAVLSIPQLTAGNYYILINIDAADSIAESDENNNISSQPLAVENVNLVLDSITVPSTANINDNVSVNYIVFNTSEKPLNGSWTDSLYLSTDSDLDSNDLLVAEKTVNQQLAAHGQYVGEFSFTVPNNISAGYNLVVKVNSKSMQAETKYTDNIKSSPINITRFFTLNVDSIGEGKVLLQVQSQDHQIIQSFNYIALPFSSEYEDGTVLSLKAEPTENWHFSSWSGGITSTDNPSEFALSPSLISINNSLAVEAVFKQILDNPSALTVVPKDEAVDLAWNPVEDHNILKQYNIYVLNPIFLMSPTLFLIPLFQVYSLLSQYLIS